MAKSWTPIDATRAPSFIMRGCGQGTGQGYKPWLDEEKVWAHRPVTSLKGLTTRRVHYLTGELANLFFFVVEWSPEVLDIREQYPLLPLSETLAIAKDLGIKHPVHGQTRKPVVLVTDFLLTVKQDGGSVQEARALAPVSSLEDQRTIELLEIERCYWAARGIDWGIVTEHEIPAAFANNVHFLHGHMINGLSSYLAEERRKVLPDLVPLLTHMVQEQTNQPLNHLTRLCDRQFGCDPGTSLCVVYHLLATRKWRIDMQVPINPHLPLVLLSTDLKKE